METQTKILITDRNRGIRHFLMRELEKAGFGVEAANTAYEVVAAIYREESPDLLILDPDIVTGEESLMVEKLKNRLPNIPVILHVFPNEHAPLPSVYDASATVAKSARSAELLIRAIGEILAGRRAKTARAQNLDERKGASGSRS